MARSAYGGNRRGAGAVAGRSASGGQGVSGRGIQGWPVGVPCRGFLCLEAVALCGARRCRDRGGVVPVFGASAATIEGRAGPVPTKPEKGGRCAVGVALVGACRWAVSAALLVG